jgi:hypothetical protein
LPADRATFAALLEKRGPSITGIAREMGVSPETARYWYRQCILNRRGFALHAVLDEQELGLRRTVVLADLEDRYWPHARDIFEALNHYLGLTYYIRALPSGTFVNTYQVPKERQGELLKALDDLRAQGVFRRLEVMPMEWRRLVPMKTEYYNFTKGVWDFDWASAMEATSDELPPLAPSAPVKFDYDDLLILSRLQIDAARSVKSIVTHLKMKYDVAFRHYTHIMDRGMIAGYKIRWLETSVKEMARVAGDWRETLIYHAQHKYQTGLVLLRNLRETDQSLIIQKVSALPFLYNLNGGDGNLYFEIGMPYAYQSEVLHFLRQLLSPYRDSLTFLLSDATFALAYTIPFELFDRETNSWTYRSAECSAAFESLLPKMARAASSGAT